jgi:hypothetical protein
VISRGTEKDAWDNVTNANVIYSGECNYQEGGTSFSRIFTVRNPTIFLPDAYIDVKINDAVTIVTEFGRELTSIVKSVRDINLPWRANVRVTRIELKQAQGE